MNSSPELFPREVKNLQAAVHQEGMGGRKQSLRTYLRTWNRSFSKMKRIVFLIGLISVAAVMVASHVLAVGSGGGGGVTCTADEWTCTD